MASTPAPTLVSYDDTAVQQDREDAFSAEFEWAGQPLQPLSLERYNIFVTQRIALKAPPLGDALRDGGAFFPDALRLIWLCSQPANVLHRLRRDPEALQDAIEAWATVHAPLSQCQDIISLGLQIFNAAFDNQHESRPSTRAGRAASGN